jgi:hypothetical protein
MAAEFKVPFCDGSFRAGPLTIKCPLPEQAHRHGEVTLDILHWTERRFTRRGAKNFLMLIARQKRLLDPEFLNIPEYDWMYEYNDSVMAQRMAGQLGFRIPAHLFDMERNRCARLAHKRGVKLSLYPAIYAWTKDRLTMRTYTYGRTTKYD